MANPQNEQANEIPAADTANQAQLEGEAADILAKLYWQRRVEYQIDYYQKRTREYEQHVDVAFRLGAILMTFSSLLASLGIVVSSNEWAAPLISLLTAIIPAIVSYIAAFRQLYQWDRQLTLYRDTQINLETAKLAIPDLDALTTSDAPKYFPQLVKAVENVLQQEVAQWGQIAQGQVEGDDDAEEDLNATLRAFLTDSEGNVNQEQLDTLTGILRAAESRPEAGQYRQSADQLDTQSSLLDTSFYEQQSRQAEEAKQRRERAAAIARAASQTSTIQTDTSSDSSPSASVQPILPAPTAVMEAVIEETVEETIDEEFIDEPIIEAEPELILDDTIEEPEPEIPIASQPLATEAPVTINPETVKIADNVNIGTPVNQLEEDFEEEEIEVEDDSEPPVSSTQNQNVVGVVAEEPIVAAASLPEEETFAQQFPQEEVQSELNLGDSDATVQLDEYDVDDYQEPSTYDDDSDDYDIEEIDNY